MANPNYSVNEPTYNFCPLLRCSGYRNGMESCSPMCALYVTTDNAEGCALSVIAQEIAERSSQE